jgi:hypothetical protein
MPLIKLNNRSIKDVTSLPFGVGNMILISSQTASNSASISFTTGINSTYKEYQFYFINCHPANNDVFLTFNLSTDGGSNYNVTKTSTSFIAYLNEAGNDGGLQYQGGSDLAQSTSYQILTEGIGNSNDDHCSGILQLFNPASTTYVKHFIGNFEKSNGTGYSVNSYTAGYGNTTSAINAIRFQMSSGNIDDGTIAMFGVL